MSPKPSSCPLAAFLCTFAAYLHWLEPAPSWLDSPEIAGAAASLGIAHPPGEPLALILGKAFTFLPIGPLPFRVALASATFGALSAAIVAWVIVHVANEISPAKDRATRLSIEGCALGASLAFAFTWAHAFQCVRTEVYALSEALTLFVLALVIRARPSRSPPPPALIGIAAFAFGLGLANHHLAAFCACAPIALWLCMSRLPLRVVGLAMAMTTLGLCVYAYLPLRGHSPAINWGHPTSWERFLWVVSAKTFQKTSERGEDASLFMEVMFQLTPLGLGLALGGVYALLSRKRTFDIGLGLLGFALTAAASTLVVGFDPTNPDRQGWLAPTFGALVIFAGVFACLVGTSLGRLGQIGAPTVLLLLGLGQGVRNAHRLDLSNFYAEDILSHYLLDSLPPRGRLETAHHGTLFGFWHDREVEGARPDLEHYHRHFAGHPAYAPRQFVPNSVEIEIDTTPTDARQLLPSTIFYRTSEAEPSAAERLVAEKAQIEHLMDLDRRLHAYRDLGTRRAMLWRYFLVARFQCMLGRPGKLAAHAIMRAREWNEGPSPEIDELERICGSNTL